MLNQFKLWYRSIVRFQDVTLSASRLFWSMNLEFQTVCTQIQAAPSNLTSYYLNWPLANATISLYMLSISYILLTLRKNRTKYIIGLDWDKIQNFKSISYYIYIYRSYNLTNHSIFPDSGRLLFSGTLSVAIC